MVDYPHIIYVPLPGEQQLFIPANIDPPDPPDPIPTTEPKIIITIADESYTLLARDGEQLDSYYDPMGEFVQDCILCTISNSPFRAYYRPDQNSQREEWIFEWGDPWTNVTPENLAGYTVEITCKDGTIVNAETTKGHYWYARWRWQSEPRIVRKNASQLWNQNLIPMFDPSGLATGPILTVSDYEPMATCGIPADQAQTGGYPGLGIQTGWQTQYLTRGAPEVSFRNQAEASGSYQSHVRDTNTQAPIDIINDYPSATMYSSSQGSPYIPKGPQVNKTDQGHMPSLCYVPFLLTGDPYYLEEMQFWSNHNMLTLPSNSRFMVNGRYLAWPTRAIAECVIATPDTVPNWLLPKSYWIHWLDVCRGYIEDRMINSSDPYFYIFHTVPDFGQTTTLDPSKTGDHVWQQNMLELVASWISSWRQEWIEPAEWLIHSAIDRASPTSGWVRTHCSPYHMRLQNASVLREAMDVGSVFIKIEYAQRFRTGDTVTIDSETFVLECASPDGLDWTFKLPRNKPANHAVNAVVYGNKCLSWAEASELNILTYGWNDTDDNDHIPNTATDLTYISYQRAALAQALHSGLEVTGLQDAYNWIDSELRRMVTEKHLPVGDNWCVMPNVSTSRRKIHRRSDRGITDGVLLDEVRGED